MKTQQYKNIKAPYETKEANKQNRPGPLSRAEKNQKSTNL